jgi:hypothetical protein
MENKDNQEVEPQSIAEPQIKEAEQTIKASVEEKPLVKAIPKFKLSKTSLFIVLGAFLVVLAGIASGWLLSGKMVTKGEQPTVSSQAVNEPMEAGVADESTFRDSAEGVLQEGGINGEGTHHLDRETGEAKYVYLTSTVIDLDKFVGKNVTVWGETIKAKSAGWLMDVGKIKVNN